MVLMGTPSLYFHERTTQSILSRRWASATPFVRSLPQSGLPVRRSGSWFCIDSVVALPCSPFLVVPRRVTPLCYLFLDALHPFAICSSTRYTPFLSVWLSRSWCAKLQGVSQLTPSAPSRRLPPAWRFR